MINELNANGLSQNIYIMIGIITEIANKVCSCRSTQAAYATRLQPLYCNLCKI